MLLSLAFVPLNDVDDAYKELYDDIPEDVVPIATYFDETYVRGRKGRGRRATVPPRFSPILWNCYDATLQNLGRTNNASEGWHNKFQGVVGKHHASLYTTLAEFKKEQDDIETILAQVDLGQSVKAAPKKKWLIAQRRIRNIVATYETYKEEDRVLEYLRTLGHNFIL